MKVTVNTQPSDSYWDNRQAEFAGGVANADVMYNQPNWVLGGALAGMFVDLMPMFLRDELDLAQHYKAALDSWTWKGKLYGLPFQIEGETVSFIKQLLLAKGAKLPDKGLVNRRSAANGAQGERPKEQPLRAPRGKQQHPLAVRSNLGRGWQIMTSGHGTRFAGPCALRATHPIERKSGSTRLQRRLPCRKFVVPYASGSVPGTPKFERTASFNYLFALAYREPYHRAHVRQRGTAESAAEREGT